MNPVSSLPAISTTILALLTTLFLLRKFPTTAENGRFLSIDGLRGYLAFFVFLHHSSIWYYYLRTDTWEVPPSKLYTHFGQSSVALFFMITGFLFFTKLLNNKKKPIDWLELFTSRVMRLGPLYFFVIFFLFLIVIFLSNWTIEEPILSILKKIIYWLSFTILGAPDLNGINDTKIIISGVTWSLIYEWKFYLALPLISMLLGMRPQLGFIAFSLIFLLYLEAWKISFHYLAFLGGISSAILVRFDKFCLFSASRIGSVITLVSLISIPLFYSAYSIAPLLILTIFFSLIAGGNSLFGILTSLISRTMGDLAYSIYLLHGLLLFVFFKFLIGFSVAKSLTPLQHWLIIFTLTPILIIVSMVAFRTIEKPCMKFTPHITKWINEKFYRIKFSLNKI